MATNANAVAVHSRVRVNRYYAAALQDSLPTYAATVQLRAALLAAQQQLPAVPDAPTLQSADDDRAQWLDTVAAIEQATHARAVKSAALADRIHWCDLTVEDLVTAGTDDILAHLHDALTQLMTEVGAIVAKLRGASDPQEAIARNVAAEWRKLTPLVGQHNAVRAAQSWAMGPELVAAHTSRYLGEPVNDLVVANLDEVWTDRDNHTINFNTGAPLQDSRPWPDDEVEQLIWLCTSGAKPWIPTTAELRALTRARATQANQPPDEQPDNLVSTDRRSMTRVR